MAALMLSVTTVSAATLAELNARILDDPANIELNLDYALVAEGQGKYRLALAAYERILLNHPGNEAALRGLTRVRRIIEPPSTRYLFEAGAGWRSNPLNAAAGSEQGWLVNGRARMTDERRVGDHRWRTIGTIVGEKHFNAHRLDYLHASGKVGPLLDLETAQMTLYPAIGGGAAMTQDRFYYADANVSATLEGLNRWAQVRAGYRLYDDVLTSTQGFYVDARGRFTKPNILMDRDAFTVSPSFRWNEIAGVFNDGSRDFSPGRYLQGNVRLSYDKILNDKLTAGVNVKVTGRHFLVDTTSGGDLRQDWTVAPGATLLFREVLGVQTDVRLSYRFEYTHSNDPDHSSNNHIVGIAAIARR